MLCFDTVVLCTLISILMLQTTSTLLYLAFGQFSDGLFEASASLVLASWVLNGIVLVFFVSQSTHFKCLKFSLRVVVFFPTALILTNCLIGLHPRVLCKMLKFVGISETRVILDAVLWIYSCKIVFTGLIDTFAQVLIASHNYNQVPWVSAMFMSTSVIIALTFFLFSITCTFEVIKKYVQEYEPVLLVREKLLKPLVFEFRREDPDTCTICRESIDRGHLVAEMPRCCHKFHDV